MPLAKPTEQQSRIIWVAATGLAIGVIVALVAAAVWGLGKILDLLSPVLWPLAIAAVVACLLSPAVDFFERRKVARARAIVLVFVLAFLVVAGVVASVIPHVVEETEALASDVPRYSLLLQQHIKQFLAQPPDWLRPVLPNPTSEDNAGANSWSSALASTTNWLGGSLPAFGPWLLHRIVSVASGFGLLAGLALIPIYAFHFLLEKRGITGHWKDYLPLHNAGAKAETIFMLEAIGQYLVAFFRGQLLVAICNAVMYTIGFFLVGLHYSFLIGFMAVFLTMIPFFGSLIVCIVSLFLAFVQFLDWQHPALVLAVFAVVQTLESMVIGPRIMGNRVGLHPLIIIIAVMTGTTLLGGILGGLLAIPVAAALRVILARYVWEKV